MDGPIADTDQSPTVIPGQLPETKSAVRTQSSGPGKLELDVRGKHEQCKEGVVPGRTRRVKAAVIGAYKKNTIPGALALRSVIHDAEVKGKTVTAETMDPQSVLALQSLSMTEEQASDMPPEPKNIVKDVGGARFYRGCHTNRNRARGTLKLDQRVYLKTIVDRFNVDS